MKFLVRITTDNAAFDPDPVPEVVRLLRDVADRIEDAQELDRSRLLFDVNGNVVGEAGVTTK